MSNTFEIRKEICSSCKNEYTLEIGVASAGWKFHFHAYIERNTPFGYINVYSLRSLIDLIKIDKWKIFDEYNREYSVDEFIDCINQFKEGTSTYEIRNNCWEDRNGFEFNLRD